MKQCLNPPTKSCQLEIFAFVVKRAWFMMQNRWEGQDCELGRKQNPHPFLFIVGNKKNYFTFSSQLLMVMVGMEGSWMT